MLDPITLKLNVDPLILNALSEDINNEDVSTNSVMPENVAGQVDLICKEDGIICGLPVFERVFYLLDPSTQFDVLVKDGDAVKAGQKLGTVYGDIRVLLSGERTALNYLQRMSGIATYTREMAELLKDSPITLLDSRKTTPNNRVFEKYAVKIGGGKNHRYNLSDGVLLKIITSVQLVVLKKPFLLLKLTLPLSVKSKSKWKHLVWLKRRSKLELISLCLIIWNTML